ncbi:hypothetical protein Tco_1516291 [Tanacetum coccineum]
MSNSNTNLQTQSSNALHNAIMETGSKDRPPMLAPLQALITLLPILYGKGQKCMMADGLFCLVRGAIPFTTKRGDKAAASAIGADMP